MEHRISILFYAKKSKPNRDGLIPVFIRITINGLRLEHAIQRYVDAARWSGAAGKMKGNTEEARQFNLYLDTLTGKVLRQEREMVQDGKTVTLESFRGKWPGVAEKPRMLLEIFQQHNDRLAALIQVGKDFAPGTLERYKTARDHTLSFLQWKYKISDISTVAVGGEGVGDEDAYRIKNLDCYRRKALLQSPCVNPTYSVSSCGIVGVCRMLDADVSRMAAPNLKSTILFTFKLPCFQVWLQVSLLTFFLQLCLAAIHVLLLSKMSNLSVECE